MAETIALDLQQKETIALDQLKQLIQTAFGSLPTTAESETESVYHDCISCGDNNTQEPQETSESETSEVRDNTQTTVESEIVEAAATEETSEPLVRDNTQTPEVSPSISINGVRRTEVSPSVSINGVRRTDVSIYGVSLLRDDDRRDVVLLKFLRARDLKVNEAFNMIRRTLQWRDAFEIEALLQEDLGNDYDKVAFMHGVDREGHPVCYNVYGEFESKILYANTFSDEEKRTKFLRWRIQLLEKSIRKLDFSGGGISTMVQITDLKKSPGLGKWKLRATNQALLLLQDNYPNFVAKHVFINAPCWYAAFHQMISPYRTERTQNKYDFAAGPSHSAKTLFKYITPEQVPVQYGGFSKEGEQAFSATELVAEITMMAGTLDTRETIEVPILEACLFYWEVRVLGWEVSFGVEFVPIAEDGFRVILYQTKKIERSYTQLIGNSFNIREPGNIVFTIGNSTKKKKKIMYRFKTKPCSPN